MTTKTKTTAIDDLTTRIRELIDIRYALEDSLINAGRRPQDDPQVNEMIREQEALETERAELEADEADAMDDDRLTLIPGGICW